jgi:protocatechuate 3,4-dioxygenase beta subunit
VLSVFSTNDAPAVNQSFTVYGTLQDGVSGAPLAGQSITLEVEQLWSGKYVNVVTTTGANGTYTVNLSESAQGVYGLYPTFAGNPSYSPSTGYLEVTVGNPIATTLSLNIPNSNPAVSQSFTMSGYLTDTNGTPISGRQITVDVRLPTGDWTPGPGATTDSNGHYSIATSEQAAGEYRFEVYFLGDGIYAGSGNWALRPIGTLQSTTISATTNVTKPGAGASFTLSGTLTDANGTPLAGKEIDLYQYAASGANSPDIFQTRYTDQNGHYSFVLNDTSGGYMYTARFPGDQTYAYSQAVVNLVVGST